MSEQDTSTKDLLEGNLHDLLTDLVYEKLSPQARQALYSAYQDKRHDAVDELHGDLLEQIEETVEDLENFVEDLPDKPLCPNCGGSGGGPGRMRCPTCSGSGYA